MSFFDAPGDEEQHVDQRYEPEDTSIIPVVGKFFNQSQHDDGDDSDSEYKDEERRHMEVVQHPSPFLSEKVDRESRPGSVSSSASEIPAFTSPTTSGNTTSSPFTSISTSDEAVTQAWSETGIEETPAQCPNPHCACSSCSCGPGCQCGVAEHGQVASKCPNPQCACTSCSCGPGCQCGVAEQRQEMTVEIQQSLPSSASTVPLPGLSAPRLLPVKPIKPPRPRPATTSAMLPTSDKDIRPRSDALVHNMEASKTPGFGSGGVSSATAKPQRPVAVEPIARPAVPIQEAEYKEMGAVAAHPAEQEQDPVQPLINKLHEKLRTTSRSLPPLALNVAKQQKEAVVSMADLLVEDPLTLLPVINALHKRISKLEKKVFGQNELNQQQTQRSEQSPEPGSPGIHLAGD